MGLRYNPFTGSFDMTRSPGSYLNGEVAAYSDLPLDTAAAPLNSAWLVRGASGLWLLSRKPAGIYVRTATTGVRDADYTYAGTFPDVFSDANFVVYNDADSTKNLKLDASAITTGTTRTLTVPDASGTLPLLETANTFSANQTLDGTNNVAPNQTAASGSSIMTRQLTDDRYWTQPEFLNLNINNFTNVSVGGESLSRQTTTFFLQGGNTQNVISNSWAKVCSFPRVAGPRETFDFSKKMRVKIYLNAPSAPSGSVADTTVHYIFPVAIGYDAGVPTYKSFGFAIDATDMRGFVHDGTSYSKTSTGVAFATNTMWFCLIESDGAGGYSFWVNSGSGLTLLGTLTGPTGTQTGQFLFGANARSTAINNDRMFFSVRSLDISIQT